MVKQSAEHQYLDLLKEIRDEGDDKTDRTGTGTRSVFGPQMRYDLREGFPALTTKRVALGAVATELCWMTQGDRNLRYLVERNCNIWNEWPYGNYFEATTGKKVTPEITGTPEWREGLREFIERVKTDDAFSEKYGDLGPVYGYQWRHWPNGGENGIDQLAIAQRAIRERDSKFGQKLARRNVVNAWNVSDLAEMDIAGLPPCHMFYQFYVSSNGELDMKMYQRSADMFLGVPFNMAQYAMLLSMMAQTTDTTPRYLTHTFGDAHIYNNHFEQVETQLAREPYTPPTLVLNPDIKDIGDFKPEDIKVENYKYHPGIKAPVAV